MKSLNEKSIIIINAKKMHGEALFNLVGRLDEIHHLIDTQYDIILAVQTKDANHLSKFSPFKIFIQDIFSDDIDCFLAFNSRLHSNISGVILNHPEKKLLPKMLRMSVEKAKELSLKTLICATTIEEALDIKKYKPDFIAIENQYLIGKDISITDVCPEIVQIANEMLKGDVLFGAGIRTSKDLRHVIDSGGAGVLVSSLILKSENPADTLMNFIN